MTSEWGVKEDTMLVISGLVRVVSNERRHWIYLTTQKRVRKNKGQKDDGKVQTIQDPANPSLKEIIIKI